MGAEGGERRTGGGGGGFRRWLRIIGPSPRAEVDEELEFHLEQRARDYEARGLDPESARAAARERLGELAGVRAECTELLTAERRSAARRQWVKVSWLDFKLGFRMLVKYPGLTIVGGLAMAFAIWIGVGSFEFIRQIAYPSVPLHEGHRVVGVHLWDASASRVERRVAHEFVVWRDALETVDDLGAFRTLDRNLITGEGVGEPVEVAEITASGFDVARVAPLLGRPLVAADEAPGAPPVAVLGHDVWERRFGSDPDVVGTMIRLGGTQAMVVGVMPEGFEFPVAQSLWTPLGLSELDARPREGPGLRLFGRLAPGASMADARAELRTLGERLAADLPETHEHLRPQVLPYAKSIVLLPNAAVLGLTSVNLFVVALLVLICGNVALLLFARAATREGEILVRSALGASRGRIVGQLFIEALILGAVAAALGLAAAGSGLRWMYGTLVAELAGDRLPFWFAPSLSPATIGYALLLTLLAAAVAGVIPALKVTGRKVETRLREVSAGGGGLRFGGVWTFIIVAQIAVTVFLPFVALAVRADASEIREMHVPIEAERYLSVRLELDRESDAPAAVAARADEAAREAGRDTAAADDPGRSAFAARYRAAVAELERRLEESPGVAGVTFADRLPRMYHPYRLIEMDEGDAAPLHPDWPAYRVTNVAVALDYFDVLDVPVLAGRGFHSGDLGADARTVLVNESFVRRVLGGRNPLGRHIRYTLHDEEGERDPEAEPWYAIVGVVPDLGLSSSDYDPKEAGIYHPAEAGAVYPVHMAVHVPAGDAVALAHEIRTLAPRIDPGLRLHDPIRMDRLDESELRFYSFWFWIVVFVSGVALTLSLAGIYAVMSFAVTRRTREIGIRVALGGSRRRVIGAILRRPMVQVGLGFAVAGLFLTVLLRLASGDWLGFAQALRLAGYMLIMLTVCALACIVPARRALSIEPADALREDG